MKNYRAIIVGGTGLIGQSVINHLLEDEDFEKVYIVNRRKIGYDHPKAEEIITDLDKIDTAIQGLQFTHAFCTLGTTIKKAGSKEAFKKVDYEYPLQFAKAVKDLGVKNYSIVTAMGTDKPSFIFYNQVKYEITEALSRLHFDTLNILQPSLLLGERNEGRFGEELAQKFFKWTKPLWKGPLLHMAGIEGRQVAKAMVIIAKNDKKGIQKYPSGDLQKF